MNKKIIFFIACAGMLLFGVTLITLGAVLPDLKDKFHLDELTAGALFAILPFGILAGSLLFGYCCDRYGYKWFLIICCLLIAVGLAGIAYLESMFPLKIFIFIFGLGGGCVNGATNALVSDISDNNKGANLSLLGVFFAIGALGMPLILGILKDQVSFESILLYVAIVAALIAIIMLFVVFPPPKNHSDVDATHIFKLFGNPLLLLIAFFLFFQSSLEAIVHNWITIYMNEVLNIAKDKALYALTLNVVGMAVMRLLIGSIFRKILDGTMLQVSMAMLLASSILLIFSTSYGMLLVALTVMGGGLAAGFPMMYAIVGRQHARISATAFSFILVIALAGNMLVNYFMGIIAKHFGIKQVVVLIFIEVLFMCVLCRAVLMKNQKRIQAA